MPKDMSMWTRNERANHTTPPGEEEERIRMEWMARERRLEIEAWAKGGYPPWAEMLQECLDEIDRLQTAHNEIFKQAQESNEQLLREIEYLKHCSA